MDNQQPQPIATGEAQQSRAKTEIIKEAKRIEESGLYSSKGHFAAASFWSNFHLWVGIPAVVLSAFTGASSLSQENSWVMAAGIVAIVITALTGVMTFLNPNERASAHLNAGNQYAALQDRARIFWTIDCWRAESDDVLDKKLRDLSDQKDRLNQSCPQLPRWAYKKGKKGILAGETEYSVDKLQA